MSAHAHSEHGLKVGQNPTQAAQRYPLSMGQLYPQGDIFAVIHDRAEAEKAQRALREAGVPEDEVDIIEGEWFVQAVRRIGEQRNPLQRVLALLAAEERDITCQYIDEAKAGSTIVVVHAEQPEVRGQLVDVLRQHGAHLMRHFGRLGITYL